MGKVLQNLEMYIQQVLEEQNSIPENRKPVLQDLKAYISNNIKPGQNLNLNFICTHNSRRSQLSQAWAQTAAFYYGLPNVACYSGGVEVTAFNERAVIAIQDAGFKIVKKEKKDNPIYFVYFSEEEFLTMYSKLFDDPINAHKNFAAIMTCAEADENCPFIPGADARIPLRYNDPKEFDGTPLEAEKYKERCFEIAVEMFYVFSKI